MRVAVAVENDLKTISPVFSRAPYFLIQEDGKTINVVKNPYTHAWPAAPYVVEMLSRHGVRKVIAGNFGPIALEHLRRKGIQAEVRSSTSSSLLSNRPLLGMLRKILFGE
mgnify:CR=1 FL=1